MKIRCIGMDLDKTALALPESLGEENRAAIQMAAEKGIFFVAASGRPLGALPEEIFHLPAFRYAITSNGASVYDLRTGACLVQYKLTPESVCTVLEKTKAEGILFEAFIEGKGYAQDRYVEDPVRYGAGPGVLPYIQRTRTPGADMETFLLENRENLDSLDIVVKEPEKKKRIWEYLEKEVEDIYVTSSVPQLLEISHKNAGKEKAAEFLMARLGLERENLAAFGDGENDCGLLRFAGTGFAVENAVPACREAADKVVSAFDRAGVAEGIRWILEESGL